MANNKKRHYHRPPAHNTGKQKPLRVSQCMIVKNEEKNIEKALSWGKGFVFEQIVVDTGSTDRTVEIAESMGAKVFHFEWVGDFSAAKNFAIDQARGDWVAFLDADEYFPDKDVKALDVILRNIQADPKLNKIRSAIRCPIVNLDDEGKPFMVMKQDRVFRNTPEIRYQGRIHETLFVDAPIMQAEELSIIHTGYMKSVYAGTNKAARNVAMIQEELDRDPDNPDLKCYLADSLRVAGETQDTARAEALYREALGSGLPMLRELRQGAFSFLIAYYYENDDKNSENFEFCKKAYEEFPESPDFCYFYARKLHLRGEYKSAWEKLTACETLLQRESVEMGSYVLSHSMMLFFQMTLTAEELGNVPDIIRCATLVLKEDKYQYLMLSPYITAFNRPGYKTSADEIFGLLAKIYDFTNLKDKLAVIRAAKEAMNVDVINKVLETFSQDELKWLTGGTDE